MALGEGEMCGSEEKGVAGEGPREPYQDEVPGAVLHRAEDAQDDGHDVQEVGQDRSPLVAQEVKDLPLQRRHLWERQTEATSSPKREGRGLLLDPVEEAASVVALMRHHGLIAHKSQSHPSPTVANRCWEVGQVCGVGGH